MEKIYIQRLFVLARSSHIVLVYTKQSDALEVEPLELIGSIQILESHQVFTRFHASG